jgi:hypothetical protein
MSYFPPRSSNTQVKCGVATMIPALSTNTLAVSMLPHVTAARNTSQISRLPPYDGDVSQNSSLFLRNSVVVGAGSNLNDFGNVQFGKCTPPTEEVVGLLLVSAADVEEKTHPIAGGGRPWRVHKAPGATRSAVPIVVVGDIHFASCRGDENEIPENAPRGSLGLSARFHHALVAHLVTPAERYRVDPHAWEPRCRVCPRLSVAVYPARNGRLAVPVFGG